ncbi:polyadenylate-binding protein-interacting protein 4-like [Hordeum vulgare]|nr:polyadenylate-binding protein-interacting protein 4-like [Hordeum vulgare]
MRELEKHASRIAREIEGEDTEDLHLAEERGLYLDEDLEHDEEIKYSAVRRDTDTTVKPFTNVPSRPGSIDTKDLPVCSSTMDDKSSSHIFGGTHLSATAATGELASEYQSNKLLPADANRYNIFCIGSTLAVLMAGVYLVCTLVDSSWSHASPYMWRTYLIPK